MAKFCINCGADLKENQNYCVNCGNKIETDNSNDAKSTTGVTTNKNKIVAGLLGIIFGFTGAHNFYLGYYGKAIAQLLISVFTCFIFSWVSEIWGFIEGILILSGNIKTDAYGNELVD